MAATTTKLTTKKIKPVVKETEAAGLELKFIARFIKISPSKVRLVADMLRGKSVDEALSRLRFVTKSSVEPLIKLISSGAASAQHDFQYSRKDLVVKTIMVNEGPKLKRFRPRAYGRSAMIRKRSSHIELVLQVKAGAKKMAISGKSATAKAAEVKMVAPEDVKKQLEGVGQKQTADQTGQKKSGFLKKVFSRKTG